MTSCTTSSSATCSTARPQAAMATAPQHNTKTTLYIIHCATTALLVTANPCQACNFKTEVGQSQVSGQAGQC